MIDIFINICYNKYVRKGEKVRKGGKAMAEKEMPSIDELIEMLYEHEVVAKVSIVFKKEASTEASKKD